MVEKLEEKISSYKKSSSQEDYNEIINVLGDLYKDKKTLFLPCKRSAVGEGSDMMTVRASDSKIYIVVLTNNNLPDESIDYALMTVKEIFDIVMEEEMCGGIIINPDDSDKQIFIRKEYIDKLIHVF
ncbi:MAG: SseB family protein [Clostridia bacterium]|nr:SseB family protein [Bacilli bacterium]MBR3511561.1 SseB family protein [Clostridia bacterium]